MILFREGILEAIREGRIALDVPSSPVPFDVDDPEWQQRIQPASIDLRVGGAIARFRDDIGMASMRMPRRLTQIDESLYQRTALAWGETFIMQPHEFVLVDVDVRLALGRGLAAYVEGKSTVGRSGFWVVNAGFVEPGFSGILVLECFNAAPFPVEVAAGDDICQIVLMQGDRVTAFPYGSSGLGSRYQGQERAQPPRQRGNVYGGFR